MKVSARARRLLLLPSLAVVCALAGIGLGIGPVLAATACDWEQAGIPEASPAPCGEAVVVEFAGIPTVYVDQNGGSFVVTAQGEQVPVVIENIDPVSVAEANPVSEVTATGSFSLSDAQETTITYGFGFIIFLLAAHVVRSWVRTRGA